MSAFRRPNGGQRKKRASRWLTRRIKNKGGGFANVSPIVLPCQKFCLCRACGRKPARRRKCPGGLSGAADHADRAVGRRRRHRRGRAPDRHHAGARSQAAGERREPHRRIGRGRPPGDRDRSARRLHVRPHHARDHPDALGGAHRSHLSRSSRRSGWSTRTTPRSTSRRTRLSRTSRSCSRISRRTRTRWSLQARGRAAAGMSRSPA